LEKASEIARAMVCSLGMSEKLGAVTYGKRQQLQFLESEVSEQRNFSDDTARLIDTEIKALIDEGIARATEILNNKRPVLDRIAEVLLEKEVILHDEMKSLMETG
ncbi:MAG: cell division protein FtsH, partial [Methylicorpusculum sp.]|nr:cell division protein FtsH [Methylicorpusculum sp.]